MSAAAAELLVALRSRGVVAHHAVAAGQHGLSTLIVVVYLQGSLAQHEFAMACLQDLSWVRGVRTSPSSRAILYVEIMG